MENSTWGTSMQGADTPPLYLSFQGDHTIYEREHFTGGVSLNFKTEDVEGCYRQIKEAGSSAFT